MGTFGGVEELIVELMHFGFGLCHGEGQVGELHEDNGHFWGACVDEGRTRACADTMGTHHGGKEGAVGQVLRMQTLGMGSRKHDAEKGQQEYLFHEFLSFGVLSFLETEYLR